MTWDELGTAEAAKAIAWENCKKVVLATIKDAVDNGKTYCSVPHIGTFGERMVLELKEKGYKSFVGHLKGEINIYW
jgi:hypothetical protein